MSNNKKQLSNSSSTGGRGIHFENRVQTSFVILMLTNSFSPSLPQWPIIKIKLQGKYQGYDTDDLIIYVKESSTGQEAKLLGQIKHTIKITNNEDFREIINAAWSDFNKPNLFQEGRDVIALISGPLSATDTDDVRTLLGQAEDAEDSFDFLRRINLSNFTSDRQRKKLEVFKICLKIANNKADISDDQLWRFLKSFRLLIYDLDIKGVTLSLLHSLIGKYSLVNPHDIFTQLKDVVEWKNEKAGAITLETIPDNIRSVFTPQISEVIPASLTKTNLQGSEVDWDRSQHATDLAVVNLLGGWNEAADGDKNVIEAIAKENFASWILKIRQILQEPTSPIVLKNGIWSIADRKKLWQILGTRIFDDHLEVFHKQAVAVLTEHNPRFDLKPNERFAAAIRGKVLKHSHFIREGIAESLALIGSYPDVLSNCSANKPETITLVTIRDIFAKADWILWGSLNSLLPLLAEAAPLEFMSAVEKALSQKPCPFDELFAQEESGVTGENYLTGLLWALEGLAWDEQYISRVAVILGELALHDPGGKWANRPANSLTTIFLPWLPQTTACIEKRKVAIKTLQKENPEKAWELLVSLLPNQHQSSSGCHKPRWRKIIPDEWNKAVSRKDYWEQISSYTSMAVQMARNDATKLQQLVKYLDHLTSESFDKMIDHLSSKEIIDKPENERVKIWEELVDLVSKHKRHADAEWAMHADLISKIESVTEKLAPRKPLNLYHRLFSEHDFDLYETNKDWQEQQKKLEERRQKAIKEILDSEGINGMLDFAKTVEFSANVGSSLGCLADSKIDSVILPSLLGSGNKKMVEFLSGFIWASYRNRGWEWVDKLNLTNWSFSQIGQFMACLPFTDETWNRVDQLLKEHEKEYWEIVSVNPYQTNNDINRAIDKLIIHNRPNSAINCLSKILHTKQPFDKDRAIKALLVAVSTKEPFSSMHTYDIVEIIKALQNDPDTNAEELFKVEWAYLPLLNEHSGAEPKTLENKLVSDYKFFCEIIRILYRSDKKEKKHTIPNENRKAIATNAYELLREWRIPPGLQPDGSFSDDYFKKWLDSVKKDCLKSGHLDVSLSSIGQVLIYAPSDPEGLWINKTIADALNHKDAESMRRGYRIGIYNSRGVHWVDPTGKPELDLSVKYNKFADEVENAGYHRFAVTLRGLADSYTKEANAIIEEHNRQDLKNNKAKK